MIGITDIDRAAARLDQVCVRTPLINSSYLDGVLGAQVYLKLETLQVGGSFKFRGAYNRLSQMSDDQRLKGVVAWSSGNHALGVASAARMLQIKATIVMPIDAPRVKFSRTEALGAEIVLYDRKKEDRESIARKIVTDRNAILVPSYDDPDIIAGQGTVGSEIIDQVNLFGAPLDAILVPCGGGGLIAGISTAVRSMWPNTKIYSVEPDGYDDTKRSLETGKRELNASGGSGLCDALLAPTPGEITFPIISKFVYRGLTVSNKEVEEAIRFCYNYLKLVVEPGGAVGLAALLAGKIDVCKQRVGIVLSGGNIDASLYAGIVLNHIKEGP